MTQPQRMTFTCHAGDLAFDVTADTPWAQAQRTYLEQYLPGPVGDTDLGRFTLSIEHDAAAGATIDRCGVDALGSRRFEQIPGIVMVETRESSGARWYTVAEDDLEHHPRAFAVRAQDRHLDLYLRSAALKAHNYPLRLIREAMLRTYEDHGASIFHAAAADLHGHGVLICGPRAAGKTTLLTSVLHARGAALLANDRILIDPAARLIAVPLPVPIAAGTLAAVPALRTALSTLSRPHPTFQALPADFGTTVKVEFSPAEYTAALGAARTAASRLRVILLPRLSDSADPARTRTLGAAEARELVTASCFTPRDEFWITPWLVPRRAADDDLRLRSVAQIDTIVASTPVIEVSFGIRNPHSDLTSTVLDLLEAHR